MILKITSITGTAQTIKHRHVNKAANNKKGAIVKAFMHYSI